MDLTPIFLDRLDVIAGVVGNVKPDQLSDPTPCDEFDVRGLCNHIIGGQAAFAAALADGRHLDPGETAPDLVGQAGDDPGAAMSPVVEMAKAAWGAPGAIDTESVPVGAGMPARGVLRIALAEVVIHGWDLAKATNQPYEIPDMLAMPMLDGMRKEFGDAPRPPGSFFGPIVEVPDDASPADKLIAFTGRTP